MKWRGRTWLQGPQVSRPGPVGQVARWCETLVAFARWCLCGFETAIAFAGEKWAFFWCVFRAQRCHRFQRSLVGGVQWCCWFHVAMFLRAVRGICRPARPDVGASAKKFALRAHNGQKLAFDGALGKYFRGDAAGAAALGKYFRGSTVVGSRRASLLCRVPGSRPLYWQC